AAQTTQRERDRDRHAREDEREQRHDAEDADQARRHCFLLRSIHSAARADPIMPNSTGAQYQRRWIERSEVTSLKTSVSAAAFHPCHAITPSTTTASASARRFSAGTE